MRVKCVAPLAAARGRHGGVDEEVKKDVKVVAAAVYQGHHYGAPKWALYGQGPRRLVGAYISADRNRIEGACCNCEGAVMAVVGKPSRFAVEYDLRENYGGVWMFGRFCYWCGGQRVGDYELGTSLRDVLFQLDGIANHKFGLDEIGKYKRLCASRRFITMPATLVFRLLDAALFGAADLNNARVAEEEQWAQHHILPGVDVFHHWKAYLVEDKQIARFIFAREPYLDVKEISLRPGEVDAVVDVVRNALNGIYERESNGRERDD
jgi:hypothetical protein